MCMCIGKCIFSDQIIFMVHIPFTVYIFIWEKLENPGSPPKFQTPKLIPNHINILWRSGLKRITEVLLVLVRVLWSISFNADDDFHISSLNSCILDEENFISHILHIWSQDNMYSVILLLSRHGETILILLPSTLQGALQILVLGSFVWPHIMPFLADYLHPISEIWWKEIFAKHCYTFLDKVVP